MNNLKSILTVSEVLAVLKTLRVEDGGEKGKYLEEIACRLEEVYNDLLREKTQETTRTCYQPSEKPDWTSGNMPVCELTLHPLDVEDFGGEEEIHLYMHRYPEAEPEYNGEYLALDKNNNYHIAYFNTANTCKRFLDPYNDYEPFPENLITGWLAIY